VKTSVFSACWKVGDAPAAGVKSTWPSGLRWPSAVTATRALRPWKSKAVAEVPATASAARRLVAAIDPTDPIGRARRWGQAAGFSGRGMAVLGAIVGRWRVMVHGNARMGRGVKRRAASIAYDGKYSITYHSQMSSFAPPSCALRADPPARLPTQERQLAIVEAVLSLAGERSPASITTSEIAAALGLTQGAVFKHFPTKESIWVATIEQVENRLMQRLEAAMAGEAGAPLAALRAMFMAHVGFVAEQPGVPRVIFHELQQPGDSAVKQQVRRLLGRYHGLLLAQLAEARDCAAVAPGLDLDAAATLFIGIVQGLVMQGLITGQPAQIPARAQPVFELFVQALGGES
jgi:AcrR family transcriptional regulator